MITNNRSSAMQVEVMCERVVDMCEFEELQLVLTEMDVEKQEQLASHLLSLFHEMTRFTSMVQWVIGLEVSKSETCNEMFKEGLGKHLLENLFFDEKGQQYMRNLSAPLQKKISEMKQGVDVRGQVGIALDQFFATVVESATSCPLRIRVTMSVVDDLMTKKFGASGGVPYSLRLVVERYFCEYLSRQSVQPARPLGNSMGRTMMYNLSGLECAISMITQTIVVTTDLTRRSSVSPWLAYLLRYSKLITDPEELRLCLTVEQSILEGDNLQDKNEVAKNKFNQFYRDIICFEISSESKRGTISERECPAAFQQVCQELMYKIRETNWVLKKVTPQAISVFTAKTKGSQDLCMKLQLRVAASLTDAVRIFGENSWTSEYDPLITKSVVIHQGQNYRESTFDFSLPFIFLDRNFSFCQWTIWKYLSSGTVIRVMKNLEISRPGGKSLKAGRLEVCGQEFKTDPGDPRFTKIQVVFHANFGNIPKFVRQSIIRNQVRKFAAIARSAEGEMRPKKSVTEERKPQRRHTCI